MEDEPQRKPHPDPEVEALLHFEPVVRKCVRHDGWLADRQREFIVALTILGHAGQAAIAVGGTMSGAYKLRSADGGEGFAAAWDSALALHLRRNPRPEPRGRPSRGELQSGTGRQAWPARGAAAAAAEPVDPEQEAREADAFWEQMLQLYRSRLAMERQARIEGRIVEADFYVRKLCWMEVVFDLGGRAMQILQTLERDGHTVFDIVATPMSEWLAEVRRALWLEKGEADRPPPRPPGPRGPSCETDPSNGHNPARDGDYREWLRRREEEEALAAEVQRAWEEKAAKDSEAWRKRLEDDDGSNAEDEPEPKP